MLQSTSTPQVSMHLSEVEYDGPTKIAIHLFNCAKRFLNPHGGALQILPAIKCLYMALSMVLAPQIEVELRLLLGNVLLDHTQNFNDALEQIRKAHQLAESSLGAIKFEEKCRITRSLIDSLMRTNSCQLAQSILDNITIETLQIQTLPTWHWFLHFSLMSLQLKLDNAAMQHQALADIDGILKIIQNFQKATESSNDDFSDWKLTLASSKVLLLSFLLIVLTDCRKILSVFSIVPKASQELRLALNELKELCAEPALCNEMSICTQFFGESLLLMNSLSFSNSFEISNGITNLLALFKSVTDNNIRIGDLKLPGHLLFLTFEDFKLFGDFITLMTMRQSPCVVLSNLKNEIKRLTETINSRQAESSENCTFLDNLLMALNCFKTSLDLESGVITSTDAKGQSLITSKGFSAGDAVFNKKFKECLLSFTAHFLVKRLGIPKCVAFYDMKINSTVEVDLSNLLFLNRALITSSTIPTESLETNTQALQIFTNSVSFLLIRAIELKAQSAPAHYIRNVLLRAEETIKSQMYHEPMIECILYLLLGEFNMNTDLELSRQQLQTAFNVANSQLSNKPLMTLAAKNISKSFSSTGDDEISAHWSNLSTTL